MYNNGLRSMNVLRSLRRRELGTSGHKDQRRLNLLAEECNATSCYRSRSSDLPGNPRSTFLICFSPDRSLMASSHGDHTIRIICCKTMKCIRTLEGHPRTPWCLEFHPSSNDLLASGCLGGEVRVWDLRGGGCEVYSPPGNSVIASLAFHPEDQLLLVATNNKLLFWNWTMPKPFASVETASTEEKVRLVKFDQLGTHILTGITNAHRVGDGLPNPRQMPSGSSSSSSDGRVNQTYSCIRLDPDFIADYVARSRQNSSETTSRSSSSDVDTRQAEQTSTEEPSTSSQSDSENNLSAASTYLNIISDQQRSVLAAGLSSDSGSTLVDENDSPAMFSMLHGNEEDGGAMPTSNQPAISTLLSIVNFDQPSQPSTSTSQQDQRTSSTEETSADSSDGLVTSILSGQSGMGTGVLTGDTRQSASVASLTRFQPGTAIATATARTPRHVHTAVVVAENASGRPQMALRAAINRAIAGAFAGSGEGAVASNIINTTHRLQWWDFSKAQLPQISDPGVCVLVQSCKIHNDASCCISKDGTLLATFIPSPRGFPDDGMLAVFSLDPRNLGQQLFKKKFGPNAISVSISPLNRYVVVGLASRRIPWLLGSRQLVALIYELGKNNSHKGAVKELYKPVHSIMHELEPGQRTHVSVNAAFFHPRVGGGLVYGTNRGHLRAFYVGAKPKVDMGQASAS